MLKLAIFMVNFAGGGAERAAVMLANGLAELGHDVTMVVVSPSGPHRALLKDNVRLHVLKSGRAYRSLPQLVRFIRDHRPDALLTFMILANILGCIAKMIIRDLTLIGVEQGSMHNGYARDRRHPLQRLAYLSAGTLYKQLNVLVCVDESAALAATAFMHNPGLPTRVMPNPVVPDEVRPELRRAINERSRQTMTFVNVGRLTYQKNHDLLLDAFAIVCKSHDARLVIMGDGEERARLEGRIRELGIEDRVNIAGYVQDPLRTMAESHVFVLSSRWEGLPTVVIEALYCGLPVVTTRASMGTMELVQYGKLGAVVQTASAPELAEAMMRTALSPPDLDALFEAANKYSVREVSLGYERLVREILAEGART